MYLFLTKEKIRTHWKKISFKTFYDQAINLLEQWKSSKESSYPYQYNREYNISRVFLPAFSMLSDLNKKTFINRLDRYYDGILIMLVSDDDADVAEIAASSMNIKRSIIFANTDTQVLRNTVKKYIAVQFLESQKVNYMSKAPSFEKELDYFKKEISIVILALIDAWKNSFGDNVRVFAKLLAPYFFASSSSKCLFKTVILHFFI